MQFKLGLSPVMAVSLLFSYLIMACRHTQPVHQQSSQSNNSVSTSTSDSGSQKNPAQVSTQSPIQSPLVPEPSAQTIPGNDNIPETWQERWFDHKTLLQRIDYDDEVAIYFDAETNRSASRHLLPMLSKVWKYTKSVYGDFGGQRLYSIHHTGKHGGGHPATYRDEHHDHRNAIDCGYGDWNSLEGWRTDGPVHEVAHVVESAAFNYLGSPAFPVWKDSKWAEIFQYDVYRKLGMKADEERWFKMMMDGKGDDFPRPGTKWFKDWFYPIYKEHGETHVLARFFKLLTENFPADENKKYTRDMNMGEFIHFWSAAAKADLKEKATKAFGWNEAVEVEWQKAKKDFPQLRY